MTALNNLREMTIIRVEAQLHKPLPKYLVPLLLQDLLGGGAVTPNPEKSVLKVLQAPRAGLWVVGS